MSEPDQEATSNVNANNDGNSGDALQSSVAVKKNGGDKINPSVFGGSSIFGNPPPTKTASSSSAETHLVWMHSNSYVAAVESPHFDLPNGFNEKLAEKEDDEDMRNAFEMELRDELATIKHGRLRQEIELEKYERMRMLEATLLSQKETELLRLQQTRVDRSIARISETRVAPRARNSPTRNVRNASTVLNDAFNTIQAPRKRGRPKKIKAETADDDVIVLDKNHGEGPSTSSAM